MTLIVGCVEDAPEPVDVEGQLGPALVSSSLGEDGTLSLTFSKPVAWVTVDGVTATLTNNATRASADVESGVLDVAWTGRGGVAFHELLVFSYDPTVLPPHGPMAFLPVTPGGSIVIDGTLFDVEPFYIAKHETTNAQYAAFVQAADGFDNAAWWSDMPAGYRPPQRGLKTQGNSLLDAPRDEVSWYQAVAFTRWLNARMEAKNADISAGGLLVNGVEWEVRLPAE